MLAAHAGAADMLRTGHDVLTICPTADYELYLGRNLLGPDRVLFEPTRKLLGLWQEFGMHGTLFPDVCSAWRHRELGIAGFADRFEAQLRDAAAAGHDIQLHLHPEWLRARHVDGVWQFEPGTGSLHDLGFDELDPHGAPALIRRGKQYLEDLLRPAHPSYRCIAFRAGGWVLQPERPLIAALLAAGIRVDATVIPGARLLRTDYRIDFRRVPARTYWFVDPQRGIGVDSQRREDLLEISIAAFRGVLRPWHHAQNELRLRRRAKRRREPRRGFPIVMVGPSPGVLQRIVRKYQKLNIPRMLDLADTHEAMLATLRSYLERFDCRNHDQFVCMNGHPKDTYDLHLDEARRFFATVHSRYRDVVRFEPLVQSSARLLRP